MTIQHDTAGPGIETYRSSRFVATVDGTEQHVYGYTRAAGFTTVAWEYLDELEMSWLKFGADQTVTVTVELADATPITSANIYPRNVATNQSIVDGVLSLTVPTNERLYVEVNGERDQPLMVFAEPLKSAVPVSNSEFYADLGLPIQSIDSGTDRLTFGSSHGLTTGDEIVINLRPAAVGSFPNGLSEGVRYSVVVISPTVVTLLDEIGDAVDITQDAAAILYANVAEHTDTGNALYFPAGRYAIGRNFPVASSTTVYLDRGAIVIGSFDLRDVTGVTIRGPGQISGEFATYEDVLALAYQDKLQYVIFNGTQDADNYSDNAVKEVTVFATPFWASNNGVWSYRNVQIISPWTSNTDGFLPTRRNSSTYASEVVECFSFVGDDNVHVENRGPVVRTVSGSFFVNSAGACFHAGYEPEGTSNAAYGNTISDCDAMHLLQSSSDFGSIVRCWLDGWSDASEKGVWNMEISGLRVWGPLQRPLLDLRNFSPEWDSDIRQQYGQMAEWTIEDVSVEIAPLQRSIIRGRDVVNTPHDIVFTGITVEGELVTEDNYTDYFDVNEFPYNITWDEAPVVPQDPEDPYDANAYFEVETGTGSSTANALCSLEFANEFATLNGNSSDWADSSDAKKKDCIRRMTQWLSAKNYDGYVAVFAQALPFPRIGVRDREDRLQDSNIVPLAIKQACAYGSIRIAEGTWDIFTDEDPGNGSLSESIKVGPIEISNSVGSPSTSTETRLPLVMKLIEPFLRKRLRGLLIRG